MPAFTDEMDRKRIDVSAIVELHGVAVIEPARRGACLAWLQRHGYALEQFDCTGGIRAVLQRLDVTCRWNERFGYLISDRAPGSLDAIRDGFHFDVLPARGLVLELFRPDVIWRKDADWMQALLAIISEHSLYHLACGRRFFTLLVLPEDSPMIGQKFDDISVPGEFWDPSVRIHNFAEDVRDGNN